MRIIAGELKGRRLEAPNDSTEIRPTYDRVKEAVFSMVSPYLPGATAADLFSGTGNLGIEAISRGASHVFFGDKSAKSMALTRRNIEHCKIGERCTLIHGDWEQVLRRFKEPVDVFFLDPPYQAGLMVRCIETIDALSLLSPGGLLIAEHSDKEKLPDKIGRYTVWKEKRYGEIVITIYLYDTEE